MGARKVIVIIQSRMGSSRFPGKSFYTFKGKPALEHHIASLLQLFKPEQIVVATSENEENDVIREFCEQNGIECFSGDEENVASRFYAIAKQQNCDFYIRINGDSPLIDYRVIKTGLEELKNGNYQYDMVTTMSSNFPSGMNMEIVNTETFLNAYQLFHDSDDFEHVTKYLKDHKETYRILFLECSIPGSEQYKFSFDTKEDLKLLQQIFDKMEKPHYEYSLEEKCKLYDLVSKN